MHRCCGEVKTERQKAKLFHDTNTKELPELLIGQPVYVKNKSSHPDQPWVKGKCSEKLSSRSYKVDINGTKYRRNRVDIKPSKFRADPIVEPTIISEPDQVESSSVPQSPEVLIPHLATMPVPQSPKVEAPQTPKVPAHQMETPPKPIIQTRTTIISRPKRYD